MRRGIRHFSKAKWVKSKVEISARQTITAFLINIQPCTTGYQNIAGKIKRIINTFEIMFLSPVFMNFV